MLSPEIIKKIKKIHIKSSHTVNTVMAGHYRSVFRGSGIEFEEVREYNPGDEVKSIDWMVSARMGRPYVKLYREERELVIMLLLDMSASARFGTTDSLKSEKAAEIASVIAFNAIRNNDKVGAILFTDRVEKYIPPKKGSSHVWRVIKEFFTFEPEHKGTDLLNAVDYLGKVSRKRTVSFLVSDFLASVDAPRLRVVARRHEMIGVLLSDPGEFALPDGGILTVRDLETGEKMVLDASDTGTRNAFQRLKTREYQKTAETLKAAGVDRIEISTADSVADVLVRYFRQREKRKRFRAA
jgi:uncharacterized protein (DUF58 family)